MLHTHHFQLAFVRRRLPGDKSMARIPIHYPSVIHAVVIDAQLTFNTPVRIAHYTITNFTALVFVLLAMLSQRISSQFYGRRNDVVDARVLASSIQYTLPKWVPPLRFLKSPVHPHIAWHLVSGRKALAATTHQKHAPPRMALDVSSSRPPPLAVMLTGPHVPHQYSATCQRSDLVQHPELVEVRFEPSLSANIT